MYKSVNGDFPGVKKLKRDFDMVQVYVDHVVDDTVRDMRVRREQRKEDCVWLQKSIINRCIDNAYNTTIKPKNF